MMMKKEAATTLASKRLSKYRYANFVCVCVCVCVCVRVVGFTVTDGDFVDHTNEREQREGADGG